MSDASAADSNSDTSTGSSSITGTDIDVNAPPHIASFGGAADGNQLPNSLQVPTGAKVTLSWQLAGDCSGLTLDGAEETVGPDITSIEVTVEKDTDYVLHASNEHGEDTATVHVAVHDPEECVSPHALATASGPIAKVDGDDIYMDPPVRLLEQCDKRWGNWQSWGKRVADPKNAPFNMTWTENCCNATTTAMTLRWFAEDCKAGRSPFPTKVPSAIDPSFYPLRMAEAMWPKADPPHKVALLENGKIDVMSIFGYGTYALQNGGALVEGKPATPKTVSVPRGKSSNAAFWMPVIKDLLASGPVILGLQDPAGHFVLCQGISSGGLLILDPGVVIYQAHTGGAKNKAGQTVIQSWGGLGGYLDGTGAADKVHMPPASQWSSGVPGNEGDGRCYHLLTGACLARALAGLSSVISLGTDAKLSGGAAAAASDSSAADASQADASAPADSSQADSSQADSSQADSSQADSSTPATTTTAAAAPDTTTTAAPADVDTTTTAAPSETTTAAASPDATTTQAAGAPDATTTAAPAATTTAAPSDVPIQPFFTFASTYKAYTQQGKTDAYFLKGRYMVDVDGAPNCYHPTLPSSVANKYQSISDISSVQGPLDNLGNAHTGDDWYGVVCDPKTGAKQIQGQGTAKGPCPGYYVSSTSLVDSTKAYNDTARYVDSRFIPYFAMPAAIYAGKAASNMTIANTAVKTGDKGDYCTVFDPSTGNFAHCIFADVGGKDHFGEGSYALGKSLGTLKGIDNPNLLYVIYPHTGAGPHTIPSAGDIQSKGDQLFNAFGGVNEAKRVLGLMG